MASLRWLAEGFAAGAIVAAPVGPMALLCIRRTLERGWGSGAASGLGIALADATYSAIAVLGVGLAGALLGAGRWIELGGGAVLVLLGVRTAAGAPAEIPVAGSRSGSGLASDVASTYALTLANPPTILTFAALAAALGVAGRAGAAGWLVAGVFAGSLAWWLFLLGAVSAARSRLPAAVRRGATRASGALLAVVGLLGLVSAAVGVRL